MKVSIKVVCKSEKFREFCKMRSNRWIKEQHKTRIEDKKLNIYRILIVQGSSDYFHMHIFEDS